MPLHICIHCTCYNTCNYLLMLCVCEYVHISIYLSVCVCLCVPYLSVLKLGSNAHRGSNIRWVVQQNERNKCLGPPGAKLLNLINLTMVPKVKEN